MKCSLVRPSSKPNSLDDIVLSFNDRVTKLRFTEEERAMAIFKQLQIVFSVMKEDRIQANEFHLAIDNLRQYYRY